MRCFLTSNFSLLYEAAVHNPSTFHTFPQSYLLSLLPHKLKVKHVLKDFLGEDLCFVLRVAKAVSFYLQNWPLSSHLRFHLNLSIHGLEIAEKSAVSEQSFLN